MNEQKFSVILFTAPPPGQLVDAAGAMVKVDGRETLLRTVESFLNRDNVHQIIVAFTPEFIDEARSRFGGHFGFSGVKVTSGGPKWIDQLVSAKEKIFADATHVIVHDAARPAVPYSDIDALLEVAVQKSAIVTSSPLRSGLIELDEMGEPVAVAKIGQFASLITPFAFSRPVFDEICRTRSLPHASAMDLCEGSPLNVRVNSSADSAIAKAMLNLLPKPKAKAASPFEEAQW